ncbi:hypothetical protein T10_11566 [Trichinella papuae]|uniref:Uncharacterized protein n=1 Tax=Trichinella papuae TaxID=268474 RepID=A0A0V1MTP9_9BILA|nr:hypothetical protein T10_11566 [Trichinella papuae]
MGLPNTKKYCTRLRTYIEYPTKMSKMPPLQKCKHPASVLREFQRGCFPYPLIHRYLAKYYKKGEHFEKKVFTENAKTAKSIAHEISKFWKILFFTKIDFNGS